MDGSPLLAGVRRLLGIIAAAAVVLPFILYHPYFTSRWFRHTSQLLSLGAAFMNLLLWTGLLGRKGKRDQQLIMVSIGLGIAVSGYAVSYGILQFMTSPRHSLGAGSFQGSHASCPERHLVQSVLARPPEDTRSTSPLAGPSLNSAHSLPDA